MIQKILSCIFAGILTFSLPAAGAFGAFTANEDGLQNANSSSGIACKTSSCPSFSDEDGDGICDLCPYGGERPQDGTGLKAANGSNPQFSDTSSTASPGRGSGSCLSFTDEDGDGVCDLCPNGGDRPQDGTGMQARQGRRNSKGNN